MSNFTKRFGILAAAVMALLWAVPAQAQATRTWVSGTGNDANPCSYTAPCKTFAGAISKTAAGGEIDAQDAGGFGTVTVTKSLTIDGGGAVASILAASSNAVTIASSNVVVVLRNLKLSSDGTGLHGIDFTQGAQLTVLNCEISNMSQDGIRFSPLTGGHRMFINNTTIHNNDGIGIEIVPQVATGSTTKVVIDAVKVFNNGSGLQTTENTRVMITRSDISNNSGDGVSVVTNTANVAGILSMKDSTVATNAGNGLSTSGIGNSAIRIADTYVFANTGASILATSGVVASFGNNYIMDNGTNTAPGGTIMPE